MTAQNGRNARRRIRDKARKFVAESVGFMVIGIRKDGKVAFVQEMGALAKDETGDPRVYAMLRLAASAPAWCDSAETAYQHAVRVKAQPKRAEGAKEKRSKELSVEGE